MTNDINTLKLIACATAHLQVHGAEAARVPIPGTDKLIVIGNEAWIASNAASADNPSTAGAALDSDKVRKAFEGWYTAVDNNLRAVERRGSGYALAQTNCAWEAWLAAKVDSWLAAPALNPSEVRDQALNGIPATHRHDEGAIARCSYCGRYSLDPRTLSDRQPTCDCGKQHGWCGSFKRPTAESIWSGNAPTAIKAADQQGALGEKGAA